MENMRTTTTFLAPTGERIGVSSDGGVSFAGPERHRAHREPRSAARSVAQHVYGVLTLASAGACSYHGYRRNVHEPGKRPYLWAIGWAALATVFPVITPIVALVQGYARPLAPPASQEKS